MLDSLVGAVFTGRVIYFGESRDLPDSLGVLEENPGIVTAGFLVAAVEVKESWSGVGYGFQFVYTTDAGAGCGVPFQPGESYLIYASRLKGPLYTNRCMGTRELSEAGKDLEELGNPRFLHVKDKIVGTSYDSLKEIFDLKALNELLKADQGEILRTAPHNTVNYPDWRKEFEGTVMLYPVYDRTPMSPEDVLRLRDLLLDPASYSRITGASSCAPSPDVAMILTGPWGTVQIIFELRKCFPHVQIRGELGEIQFALIEPIVDEVLEIVRGYFPDIQRDPGK